MRKLKKPGRIYRIAFHGMGVATSPDFVGFLAKVRLLFLHFIGLFAENSNLLQQQPFDVQTLFTVHYSLFTFTATFHHLYRTTTQIARTMILVIRSISTDIPQIAGIDGSDVLARLRG